MQIKREMVIWFELERNIYSLEGGEKKRSVNGKEMKKKTKQEWQKEMIDHQEESGESGNETKWSDADERGN